MKRGQVKRVALVGYGAIGQSIVEILNREKSPGVQLVAICARAAQLEACRAVAPSGTLVTTEFEQIWQAVPDVVIEAAGHAAVQSYGCVTVGRGCDFYVLSTGVLASDEVRAALTRCAVQGGGRIMIPSGALAGFDGLLSMRHAGLTSVTYTSTKPPAAWLGTLAEESCDLHALTEAVTFFTGSAKDAALRFPRNSNLAATVAIAGLGLERTQVRLVADPAAIHNTGHLFAESDISLLDVKVTGIGFDANPKTSAITGMSVLAALANQAAEMQFV